jgi:hypothetical protein
VTALFLEEDYQQGDAGRVVSDDLLREKIDAALAKAEQSLREEGGIPLETIKVEVRRRDG